MDLTESLVEGMVKYLTGGKTSVTHHPEGKEKEKAYELEFKTLWKR